MSFEIRHQLLRALSNDVTAYEIAHKFVDDNPSKLEVFKVALNESKQAGDVQSQASAAVDKAEVRWAVLFKE